MISQFFLLHCEDCVVLFLCSLCISTSHFSSVWSFIVYHSQVSVLSSQFFSQVSAISSFPQFVFMPIHLHFFLLDHFMVLSYCLDLAISLSLLVIFVFCCPDSALLRKIKYFSYFTHLRLDLGHSPESKTDMQQLSVVFGFFFCLQRFSSFAVHLAICYTFACVGHRTTFTSTVQPFLANKPVQILNSHKTNAKLHSS